MKKTIALAAELGLARYQKLDGSANNINSHKEEPGQENIQYVLVLDLEATCWEERTSPPPEIIEFPVVLLSSDQDSNNDENMPPNSLGHHESRTRQHVWNQNNIHL